MALSSSYSPTESYATIIREEAWLQGTLLSNFFFGIQSTLFVLAFLAVFQRRNPNQRHMRIALLTFIIVLFVVMTVAQGLLLLWIQMGFITQRNYPGGPSEFLNDEYSLPANLVSTVLVVCANLMMESLLVWRCNVVCNTRENLWWLCVVIPSLLLIAVFATGSFFIHCILHSAPSTLSVLAYGMSSLALNLTATGFIAGRMLVHRHRIVSRLGPGHGQPYVSIAAVVIESAAVYTGFLVAVIVTYAIGSPATNLLQQVIGQIQAITSLLIILRIARGEGWSRSTNTQIISAVDSSWVTRVAQTSEQNVIQLGILSTRPDEEGSTQERTGEVFSCPRLCEEVNCKLNVENADRSEDNLAVR